MANSMYKAHPCFEGTLHLLHYDQQRPAHPYRDTCADRLSGFREKAGEDGNRQGQEVPQAARIKRYVSPGRYNRRPQEWKKSENVFRLVNER